MTTPHDKALEPCPFCRKPASTNIENNGVGSFWIVCDNVKDGCGCEGPYRSSPDQAIDAWNRRATIFEARGWRLIDTADKNVQSLMLGIVRNEILEEIHIGGYRYAMNDDEVSCWWSDQSDDEIVPTHWCEIPTLHAPLPVAGKGDGWLPIETAPNGRHILYVPEVRFKARGIDKKAFLPEMIRVDFHPVAWPRKPTHWRPLPAPPSLQSDTEGGV